MTPPFYAVRDLPLPYLLRNIFAVLSENWERLQRASERSFESVKQRESPSSGPHPRFPSVFSPLSGIWKEFSRCMIYIFPSSSLFSVRFGLFFSFFFFFFRAITVTTLGHVHFPALYENCGNNQRNKQKCFACRWFAQQIARTWPSEIAMATAASTAVAKQGYLIRSKTGIP